MRSASIFAFATLALGFVACSGGGGGGTTGGSTGGSGSTSGASDGAYTIRRLDTPTASGLQVPSDGGVPVVIPGSQQIMFNMAISPSDQIGVVYFRNDPDGGMYSGFPVQDVVYAEVQGGAVTVPPEVVTTTELPLGCTVAFQPAASGNSMPAVGHLGGNDYGGADAGPGAPSGSLYWVQSQGEIDYRQGPSNWTRDVCMLSSTGGSCQYPNCPASGSDGVAGPFNWAIDFNGTADTSATQLCDNPFGEVVGLWPSLLFDGGTAQMALRDVHEGQFPIQDWGASDTKMCIGGPGGSDWSWSAPLTISASGNNQHNGFGVHNQMIYANGLLAVVADTDAKDEGSEATGSGPITFTIQTGSNTQSNADWTPPINPFEPSGTSSFINNPGTGPSMVFSPIFNFGVAAVDLSPTPTGGSSGTETPALYYVQSNDKLGKTWGMVQTVFQLGSGGFFPDLQIDPNTGNPIVSFTICSQSPGFTPQGGCTATDAELDTAEMNPDTAPSPVTEIKGSFWHPRFGYLSSGKKVFVYSDLIKGGLYVATEN